MKYYAPQIAWHDRKSLYSIDVDSVPVKSDSESTVYRLATGGNDARINIWHVRILEIADLDKKKPVEEIVCVSELTQHQRAVNVIRFSPSVSSMLQNLPTSVSTTTFNDITSSVSSPLPVSSVQYLASGDDDALIYIWKLCDDEENSPNKSLSAGDFDEEVISIETWKIHKTLRGHSKDVCDLCWSASGEFIVSGGVDNLVFVWDVSKGTKLHKLQKEHSSYVLGVAYDPFERYIASVSSDRSLLIFNSKSGKTLKHIDRISLSGNESIEDIDNLNDTNGTDNDKNNGEGVSNNNNNDNNDNNNKKSFKLFHDQTMMSFSRRLTFTPGGEFLIVPAGIVEKENEEPGNALYVFSRKNLDRPSFYLPTQKFSLAVRCCPVLFELRSDNTCNIMNLPYRIIFASATEDAVYFYDSQQATPFAYVSQIHYLRLTDISWSSDGRFLMVTSSDGFTSFIIFDHNELGVPYKGKRFSLEELEPIPLVTRKSKKPRDSIKVKGEKENNDDGSSPGKKKFEKVNKISVRQESASKFSAKKIEKTTPPKSHDITKFFSKIPTPTSSPATPTASISQITATLPNKKNESPSIVSSKMDNSGMKVKSARRVSLITLFSANKNSEETIKSTMKSKEEDMEKDKVFINSDS